ncbi:histidine kinase [Chitinophaga pendula]|uniref:sensor histidine kinase n=1 Tax=Chitinophaga TaxID=79328 RepID=UPI000BAF80AF|nr:MULTISPECIES: histidine kinase [Chitinophaga]ASZ09757.1 histidine kinase [Chitinophaga sp. MD30]UCJ07302.1 histidine kinase [Chitinophaga pendula]
MKKYIETSIHILVWCAIFVVFFQHLFLKPFSTKYVEGIVMFLSFVGIFYINLLLLLPHARGRQWWIVILGWLLIVLVYSGYFRFTMYDSMPQRRNMNYPEWSNLLTSLLKGAVLVGFFIFLSSAYKLAKDWFLHERTRQQLENERLKAELDFLRSQINPHFLFNSLNNIYTMAYRRSENTPDAVMHLAEIMRYMLYDSGHPFVPLEKELHYLEQLIALQELRIQGPMALQQHISHSSGNVYIAPLILIPFVENAFKHGIINDPDDPMVLHISVEGNTLHFSSSNRISQQQKDPMGGVGLQNVRRRLELIYPKRYQLDIRQDGEHYSVDLHLQLN